MTGADLATFIIGGIWGVAFIQAIARWDGPVVGRVAMAAGLFVPSMYWMLEGAGQ